MSLLNNFYNLSKKPALRQGGAVLLDQGFLSIATFITGVLVARALSKDDYGLYVLIFSFLLIINSIHRALVTLPLTIYLPRLTEKEQPTYQGSGLIITILFGAMIGLGLIAYYTLNEKPAYSSRDEIWQAIPLIAVLIIPYLIREFIRSALSARLLFFSNLIVNFVATAFQLSAVSILFYYKQLSIQSVISSIIAASLLASGLMLWSHRKSIQFKLNNVKADFLRGLRITLWALLNVIGSMGVSQAYPWLILAFLDSAAVAVYGAAFAVSSVMAPFLRAVNAYVLPRMSHGYKNGNIKTLKRMLKLSVLAILIPYGIWTVIGSLFADEIMVLLYTKKYSGYPGVVILLLIRTMIESASAPLTPALQTMDKPDIPTKALFIGTIMTFSLGTYLIINYEIIGAALATLITSIFIAAYKYAWINRLYKTECQRT